MKKFLALATGILLTLSGMAQEREYFSRVRFDKTVHDFGRISVKDGVQRCSFTLTNIGEEPLYIEAVVSSCGCTSVEWTRTRIDPGAAGTVSAAYSNDEGAYPFDKTLTVYLTDAPRPVVLHLRGEVVKKKQ
jgi:hypothetical protein